jgi:hypothetical protein
VITLLTIGKGQKAIAKKGTHCFQIGEEITFVGYGVIDHDAPFYSYVFVNKWLEQELEADEFDLL